MRITRCQAVLYSQNGAWQFEIFNSGILVSGPVLRSL